MMKLRADQIRDAQIKDRHIDGQLSEAVLDIDFQSHADEIFDMKIIVDMVQRNGINISNGAAQFAFTTDVKASSGPGDKGVVLNEYQVKLRSADTGEPVLYTDEPNGVVEREIYGIIVTGVDAGAGNYQFTVDLKAAKPDGTVVNASFDETLEIDIVYPRRFTFKEVHEAFAANERFVDGAADITAHLNIRQLSEEIFGDAYALNNLGDAEDPFGNGNTLVEQLNKLTKGDTNTGATASATIDEVIAARGSADSLVLRLGEIVDKIDEDTQAVRDDLAASAPGKGAEMVRALDSSDSVTGLALAEGSRTVQHVLDGLYNKVVDDLSAHETKMASNSVGEGASLVGISDADDNFTATEVEGALAELYTKIVNDVAAEAQTRGDADTALAGRATALETEMTNARGEAATLDERLDVTLNNDGTMKEFQRIHKHHYYTKDIGADAITTAVFTFPGVNQFDKPKDTDAYKIFINGVLQKQSSSVYDVSVSMNDVTVEFVEGLFNGDVIGLEASIAGVTQL